METLNPPQHWSDLEELKPGYWDQQGGLNGKEQRGQEFSEKPIEALELLESLDQKGLGRRDFLSLMGAAAALAGTACVRRPVNKIIPYVVKPEEITPGVANYYASTCRECSVGCGTLVKTREGRPIKVEGNADHSLNSGALCAKGQASVLSLYDPDRLRKPGRVDRAAEKFVEASWEQVDAEVVTALRKAANGGGGVRILSSPQRGEATRRLVSDFVGGIRNAKWVEFDLLSEDEIAEAQELSYGTSSVPLYHFDRAEVVVSLGADFLGGWISPVEYAKDWAKNRRLDASRASQATMSRLITFETAFTTTGANSDLRFGVRSGDELKIALSVAHELVFRLHVGQASGEFGTLLSGYRPEVVALDVGGSISAEDIKKVARELAGAKGRSLVVGGCVHSGSPVELQVAINFLNSILENEGRTVQAGADERSGFSGVQRLIEEMNSGQVETLLISGVDPLYDLPEASGFQKALERVSLVIVLDQHFTSTMKKGHLGLAASHALETWGDHRARGHGRSLVQPTIAPIGDTRSLEECLVQWARGAGIRTGLLGRVALSEKDHDWHEFLKVYWKENVFPRFGGGLAFADFWVRSLEKGFLPDSSGIEGRRSFRSSALSALPPFRVAHSGDGQGQTVLALYATGKIGDGRMSNNGWLQEMPDPVTTVSWDNFLQVSPATAERLKVKSNDVLRVSAGAFSADLPVWVQPGLHAQTVAVALGYGNPRGSVSSRAGKRVVEFADVQKGRLRLSGAAVTLEKTGRRYELAATQGHHKAENRPIINDISLAQYRKNPAAEAHTDPHLRMDPVPTMWPKHDLGGDYRWGMSIDLNACTGCGACVVACQAENNIPIVGRDRVRMGREMHWIRIDRYYSGEPSQPDAVFQPMMCQHCENAPCETVCPVLATVHNREGLNEMVYNRCVGTRYCQNNCPYKVRRFNFFDHWSDYKDTANLGWNPDVTVRSRGIMEKCSFCVQRVQAARSTAKAEGRKIADGEVKSACQQTCPTGAITFGNINDPSSEVSRQRNSARGYRVLEVLNTKPSVTYLTKVRNKMDDAPGSTGDESGEHHG